MPLIKTHIPELVKTILSRLEAAGHQAYVVGGAVRDAILGRPITDWDVATSASHQQIREIFPDMKQFSLKHDTVTLVHGHAHFEITTFRGEKPGLVNDLLFRDFTINAMALGPGGGQVIDPSGGAADIRDRLIRAVGDPGARLREDPLRLLRGVRLASELGFRIHHKTLQEMKNSSTLITSVAPERIRDELMKILLCPRPSKAFTIMVRTNLLRAFLPELMEGYLKRQNRYHRYTILRHTLETVDRIPPEPVLRLAALFHDVAKPMTRVRRGDGWTFYGHERESSIMAREILQRLRFRGETVRRVTHLIRHHMIGYDAAWGDGAVRRLIRRVGSEDIHDLLVLRRADLLAHGTGDHNLRLAAELEGRVNEQIRNGVPLSNRDLALNGRDVMALTGLEPGPRVGEILRELNRRVTEDPELNNREDLRAIVRSMGPV